MLELALAELFEEQASEDPPPARASVAAAARQGQALRRRRRAGLAAAPVLAVGAVLAIAFTGVIQARSSHARASAPAASSAAAQAPRLFSPLRPYVSPGWLPRELSVTSFVGLFSRLQDTFSGPAGVGLNVWSRGVCRLSGRSFTCGWQHNPGAPESTVQPDVGRRIGDLSGRAAYWSFSSGPGVGTLTWQYANGGWAVISAPDLPEALRMARSLRFSTAAGPTAAFPFQLTGLPADWRVTSVSTRVDR